MKFVIAKKIAIFNSLRTKLMIESLDQFKTLQCVIYYKILDERDAISCNFFLLNIYVVTELNSFFDSIKGKEQVSKNVLQRRYFVSLWEVAELIPYTKRIVYKILYKSYKPTLYKNTHVQRCAIP